MTQLTDTGPRVLTSEITLQPPKRIDNEAIILLSEGISVPSKGIVSLYTIILAPLLK